MTYDEAYQHYLDRNAGREPVGCIEVDGEWRIAEWARQPCCDELTYRYSPEQHLRSAKHLAYEVGLDPQRFTEFVRRMQVRRTMKMRRR